MKDINGNELGLKQSPELEDKKSLKQKEEETLNFFKIAFCVDGNVKFISKKEELKKFKLEGVIQMNDSKRKKMFLGILKKKDNLKQLEGEKLK